MAKKMMKRMMRKPATERSAAGRSTGAGKRNAPSASEVLKMGKGPLKTSTKVGNLMERRRQTNANKATATGGGTKRIKEYR